MKSSIYNPFVKSNLPFESKELEDIDLILKNKQNSLNHTRFINYITHALHTVPAKKILFKMRRTKVRQFV